MPPTVEQVTEALSRVVDPNTGKDLVTGKALQNVRVEGDLVSFDVVLGYPAASQVDAIRRAAVEAVQALPGVGRVAANVYQKIEAHAVQRGLGKLPNVRNIIAVASGKGGVGKSTTAVNIALALAAEGASVGILDADIYGPSQPMMLGITGKPESRDGKSLEPMTGHGIQASSIGFLIDPDTPMVWRGPMVTQALEQLLRETNWRDLDYLVVDLPPGTGDVQLTLVQKIPISGAVIVTTPQEVALADAVKGLKMFDEVKTPVLGIVENMSGFVCPGCGETHPIFGEGGGKRVADDNEVELLGQIPIEPAIMTGGDTGTPQVAAAPDSVTGQAFHHLAERAVVQLANQSIAKPRKPTIMLRTV